MENKLKLMTAKSYSGAERIGEPFEKNGKLYQKIREKCDRCNGRGDYWWGAMINGRPQFSGTCYACNGMKYFTKEVRLYTEEEYNKMEATKEKARQKKAEEQKKKMEAEFEANRIKWLAENGWSQDGVTYIVTGDSYSIKDELKQAGFRYDGTLRWHKAEFDEKYADRFIKVNLDEVCTISAWGKGSYNSDAQKIIEEKIAAAQPKSTSEWIGEVGDKLKDIKVQLTRKYNFETRYGMSTVYNFVTENEDVLVWFSSTFQEVEPGEWCTIKYCTIKDHSEYRNVKSTIITRAKLTNLAPAQE